MEKISVPTPEFWKFFAKLWMSLLGIFFALFLIIGDLQWGGLAFFIIMFVFGFFFFHRTVWSVVDEAYDCGDSLLFVKGHKKQKVDLSKISKISHPYANFKHLITIDINMSGLIGKRITFQAASSDKPFEVPEIFTTLNKKIENEKFT